MTLSSKTTGRDVAEAALEAVAVLIMQGEERKPLSTSRASEIGVVYSKSAIQIKTRELGRSLKASAHRLKANARRFNQTRPAQLMASRSTQIVNVSEESSI